MAGFANVISPPHDQIHVTEHDNRMDLFPRPQRDIRQLKYMVQPPEVVHSEDNATQQIPTDLDYDVVIQVRQNIHQSLGRPENPFEKYRHTTKNQLRYS